MRVSILNRAKEIFVDWLLQDSLIMHRLFSKLPLASKTQIIFKAMIEILLIVVLGGATLIYLHRIDIVTLITITICAHTVNWIIFGHFMHYVAFFIGIDETKRMYALNYVVAKLRTIKVPSVLYGSLTRGKINRHSDIDVFILGMKMDTISKIKVLIGMILVERIKIFLKYRVPMDIDIVENINYLIERCLRKEDVIMPIYVDSVACQVLKLISKTQKCRVVGIV